MSLSKLGGYLWPSRAWRNREVPAIDHPAFRLLVSLGAVGTASFALIVSNYSAWVWVASAVAGLLMVAYFANLHLVRLWPNERGQVVVFGASLVACAAYLSIPGVRECAFFATLALWLAAGLLYAAALARVQQIMSGRPPWGYFLFLWIVNLAGLAALPTFVIGVLLHGISKVNPNIIGLSHGGSVWVLLGFAGIALRLALWIFFGRMARAILEAD
ncbi:MAG: hypothetical protein KIS92_23510 [Planctomycetota bacterium]|nr:hypothetical protein [Planctomycetota bacterium]